MRFNSSAGFHRSRLCSSNGLEQASHKREVGGSNPPIATKLNGLVM